MVFVNSIEELSELAKEILSEAKKQGAEQAQVVIFSNENIATRYGEKHITQNTQRNSVGFSLSTQIGDKVGIYNGTGASKNKLSGMIADAIMLNKYSQSDPEFPGFLEEQPVYPDMDKKIIEISSDEIADSIKSTIDNAVSFDSMVTAVAGNLNYNAGRSVFANSYGVEVSTESSTLSGLVNVAAVKGENESRSTQSVAGRTFNDIEIEKIGTTTAERAVLGLGQRELDVGKYNVILSQEAVVELMFHIGLATSSSMLINYQSPFKDKMGEKVFDERITITDATDDITHYSSQKHDFEGVPCHAITYIDKGILKDFAYDMRNAKKLGVETNGRAAGGFAIFRAASFNPGTRSEEQLIESIDDGVYISNLWYANFVNMPEGSITGLTKDGLFRIKDGQIVGSLKNMRFTDKLTDFLGDAEPSSNLSMKIHSTYGNLFGLSGKVPALNLGSFNFSSKGKH